MGSQAPRSVVLMDRYCYVSSPAPCFGVKVILWFVAHALPGAKSPSISSHPAAPFVYYLPADSEVYVSSA